MKRIRVAMLGPLYEIGGVTMHIRKLTKYLSRRDDIELHVVSVDTKNGEFRKENLNVHTIKKSLPYPFSIPSLVWALKQKIIEIKPDIIHVHGSFAPYSTAGTLVRDMYPALLTVHGIVANELEFRRGISYIFGAIIHNPNERYVLSKVSNIIVCSPQMEDMVRDMTIAKINVISNGIDFEDILKVKPHDSSENTSILYVGGLSKAKGLDTLLNTIPIIRKEIQNLRICIAGSGPEGDNLKRIVKELKIEEHVEFLGFVSEDAKYAYYKSCDICVFPSLYEPFGIVLLEAMACGKPVVASNVGGIPFVVVDGKTGLLFECGNIEDLAEKVIFLLQNEELREKMGRAGRERAEEFRWEKIAERTVNLYKLIIKEVRT